MLRKTEEDISRQDVEQEEMMKRSRDMELMELDEKSDKSQKILPTPCPRGTHKMMSIRDFLVNVRRKNSETETIYLGKLTINQIIK